MLKRILIGTLTLVAGTVLAADARDEVKDAAKKLADQANYSWRTTVESAGGGQNNRFRPGPTDGKTEKGGFTFLSMTRGDNTFEAAIKEAGKGALKTEDGWQSLSELTVDNGQANRGRFMAMMLQNYRTPAMEAAQLAERVKELKKTDDAYIGDLTEDGVKQMMAFRRPGGNAPEVANPKGSAKFWIKDGMLTKYEYNVQGTITFNNNDVDVNRTTTVQIKDVGSTKVDVPEEAKKKAS